MFEYDGGTVYLGADIEINGVSLIGSTSGMGEPIVIETGPYGLIVNGSLRIHGNVTISGNGSPKPVVHIGSDGWLFINSMDAYENVVSIEATGAGGTALKLERGARYGSNDDDINYTAEYFAHYKASGPESIAIDSAIKLNLENHYIDASGSGAMGILSTEPVSMYLSVVTANGEAISTPGVVTLDTCLVSPGVAGATIVNRNATGVTSMFGQVQSVSAGGETNGYFSEGLYRIYLSADGLPDRVINSRVYLDDSAVDYDKPGRYQIPLVSLISEPYDVFDLISATSPAYLTVDIIDPYIPYLNQMRYVSSFWGSYYFIEHLYSGDEELTLWYTEDDGESWSVLWKSGNEAGDAFEVEIYPDDITIYIYDETGYPSPAWFAYEVGTGKGSEVFYIDLEELMEFGEYGGERTGGDRYQRPWDVIVGGGNDADGDGGNENVNNGSDNGNGSSAVPPNESGNGNKPPSGDSDGNTQNSPQPSGGNGDVTEPSGTPDATVTWPNGNEPDGVPQTPASDAGNNEPSNTPQAGNLILEPINPVMTADTGTDSGSGALPYGSALVSGLSTGIEGFYFDLDGSDKPMELRFDFPFDDFDGLYMNGELWTLGEDYTVRAGSTIITVSAARLTLLGAGTHTLTAIFAGAPVEIVFALNAPAPVTSAPLTRAQVVPQIPLPDLLIEPHTFIEQMEAAPLFPIFPFIMSIIGIGGFGLWLTVILRRRAMLVGR